MSAASNESPNVELSDDNILKQRYVFYRKTCYFKITSGGTLLRCRNRKQRLYLMREVVANKHVPVDFLFRIYCHRKIIVYRSGRERDAYQHFSYLVHHRRTGEAWKKTQSTNGIEHIIISYNEEDQSYGVEGEVRRLYTISRGAQILSLSRLLPKDLFIIIIFSGTISVSC